MAHPRTAHLSRRKQLEGAARRRAVRVLTAASKVPVVRPFAELGMRVVFDQAAGQWERIRSHPTYRDGFRSGLRHLPKGFRPRQVLDAACGTGIAAALVLERWDDVRITGIDISPRMVTAAAEQVPGATFEVASVHDLPYEDGAFDLVVLLDGLVDVPELLRVLHRKGRLLVVYSANGTTPISRSLDELTAEVEALGGFATAHTDGPANVLVARRGR